ncbi:STAS domain-containing protein [Actinoplanes sp. NPDC049596]|uniref:STAS domain-containing protein n=1 Tax=unclassified Actinoplanes TaxID=2626549 RepID=UPI00342BCFF7
MKAFDSEATPDYLGQEPSVTSFDYQPARRLHIEDPKPAPDGSIHVGLSGELDGEESEFLRATMAEVVTRFAPAPVLIDASRLDFLDSAGIRSLLSCRRMIEEAGSRMSMPWVSADVRQVLEITGLFQILRVEQAEPAFPSPS